MTELLFKGIVQHLKKKQTAVFFAELLNDTTHMSVR